MADLDYAFLADYAAVEGGRLTAVGASYTALTATELPTGHLLSVGGRIRTMPENRTADLQIEIVAPSDGAGATRYRMKMGMLLSADPSEQPYGDDGRVGILFAFSTVISIVAAGVYVVNLEIDGVHVRRLAFEASVTPTA